MFQFHFPNMKRKLNRKAHAIFIELKAAYWKRSMQRTQKSMFSAQEPGYKRIKLPKILNKFRKKKKSKDIMEDIYSEIEQDDDIFK